MTGFTDVFGGSSVQPSTVALQVVSISANLATVWPQYATTQQPLARIMEVSATAASLFISLPDSTLSSVGQDVVFNNTGANAFTVTDFSGATLATVAPGTIYYLYLTTNSTQAGVWRVVQFGVGTSSAQASSLAGLGVKAIGTSLNQSHPTATFSGSFTIAASDRAKLYVNTGATATVTLPLASVVGTDFFFELRNQGSGVLTLAASGADTLDGVSSITLNVNESCFVHATTNAWYSVGRGRNTLFNFTQLTQAVTGGTLTLTLAQAANTVQTYTGTLASNQILVVPAVVQVYYISNSTSAGAFTFQVKTPLTGTTILIPAGQNAVVFCDGTNIVNASNTISGLTAIAMGAGTVASPPLSLINPNNGIYAPNSTALAITVAGIEQVRWSNNQNLVPNGTAGLPSYSFAASATTGMSSPTVNTLTLSANGVQAIGVDATGLVTFPAGVSGLTFTTQVPGTSNTTPATTAFVTAATFVSALPVQTTSIINFDIVSNGATASWSFKKVTSVPGTAVTATAAQRLSLENVALTAVTANVSPIDGEEFFVIANNGLITNTVDFGTKVVRGPAGTLNIISLDTPYVWYGFKFSTSLNVWMLI